MPTAATAVTEVPVRPGLFSFPRVFWVANVIELFERAAYYGTFIALVVFLTDVVGFSDVEAGWVGAGFAGLVHLLPFVTGAAADRIGFRPALALAFALLTTGYGLLWLAPEKGPVLLALVLAAAGGAFVKPIITGTASRCSDSTTRARAFSLFYMMVNIGSFSGKTIAGPVRKILGVGAVPLYSAGAALLGLLLVLLFYRPKENGAERPKSLADSLRGIRAVMTHKRFLSLILITAGFWMIQGQMYASMPKYVLRTIGPQATPEWYSNVNPLMVVLCVVPVTYLARKMPPVGSIAIAMTLIPLSALTMALSPHVTPHAASFAIHPITLMMVAGIALQGLAECFLSPRYYEYASKQAPPGQEGLYMGYQYLNVFFAWFFGFVLSGYLLDAFCPDPATLSVADQARRLAAIAGDGPMPMAYDRAHYIWYVFSGVGVFAFACLLVFQVVTRRRDSSAAGPAPA